MNRLLLVCCLLLCAAAPAVAQDAAVTYQMPDPVLAAMIDAPPTPLVAVGPQNEWLLLLEQPGYPSIAEVAAPELRLAGLRINPRDNGPSRARPSTGLVFQQIKDGKEVRVTGLPTDARITGVSWSPDGQRIAFVVTVDERLSLWTAAIKDGKARRLGPDNLALNGVYGRPFSWLAGSDALVALAVPAGRGPAPVESHVPTGPVVQENLGKKAPARTLQDLLENPYDETLFDHYATSQLMVLGLDGTARRPGRARGDPRRLALARRPVAAGRAGQASLQLLPAGGQLPPQRRGLGPARQAGPPGRRPAPGGPGAHRPSARCPRVRARSAGAATPRPSWSGSKPSTAATAAPRPSCGTRC